MNKPVWTHLDLAKHWSEKGNKRQVRIIARSCFKLMKKGAATHSTPHESHQ